MSAPEVSLLFGSGFSIPAGYPSMGVLNARLGTIKQEEICVHTSGDTYFLNGQTDPNAEWQGKTERFFMQEFIRYYGQTVLGNPQEFNYERFYDYYMKLYAEGAFTESDKAFFRQFRAQFKPLPDDHHLLLGLHHGVNQLLAQLLSKRPVRAHLCRPYPSIHKQFLNLCDALGPFGTIHIHSLNHDLVLEGLAISDAIGGEMDDGFVELGSPFYGEISTKHDSLKVRLPYFADHYESRFRLYKLHGSIDFYWFGATEPGTLIRTKYGVGTTDFYKEVQSDHGLEYVNDTTNYYPDFLSGRDWKRKRYPRGSYYPRVFQHFEENLAKSVGLIVIGYGFGDAGINTLVADNVLGDSNKRVVIVDVHEPAHDLIARSNVVYVCGGVEGMDVEAVTQAVLYSA